MAFLRRHEVSLSAPAWAWRSILPDPRLAPAKPNEGWSERLRSGLPLTAPADVDDDVARLMKVSWAVS